LVNLIPDPCDFDFHLREQLMRMAQARSSGLRPAAPRRSAPRRLAPEARDRPNRVAPAWSQSLRGSRRRRTVLPPCRRRGSRCPLQYARARRPDSATRRWSPDRCTVSVRTGIGGDPNAGVNSAADGAPRPFWPITKWAVPARMIAVPAVAAHNPMKLARSFDMWRLSEWPKAIVAATHRACATAPHDSVTADFLLPHGNDPGSSRSLSICPIVARQPGALGVAGLQVHGWYN
jgi:hypothetical protein